MVFEPVKDVTGRTTTVVAGPGPVTVLHVREIVEGDTVSVLLWACAVLIAVSARPIRPSHRQPVP